MSCDNRLYNVSYTNFAFIEDGTIVREYNSVVYAPYWACGDVIYNSVNDIFYNIQEAVSYTHLTLPTICSV